MALVTKNNAKKLLLGSVLLSFMAVSACETPAGISKTRRDRYHHAWGYENEVVNPLPILENPPPRPEPIVQEAPAHNFEHVTHLENCTGTFSLADEQTGRVLAQGRGFNTQDGIVVLDARGNRTSQIINNGAGQSLIFQPDCNCAPQMCQHDDRPPPPMEHHCDGHCNHH